MALWYCTSCTAGYAVGLTACPQCGATEHEEEHEHMAKITSAGPSYEPGKNPNEPDAEPVDAAALDETTDGEDTETATADEAPAQTGQPESGQADGEHELPPPPPQHE